MAGRAGCTHDIQECESGRGLVLTFNNSLISIWLSLSTFPLLCSNCFHCMAKNLLFDTVEKLDEKNEQNTK